jgi:nitrogen fixation protein FixH
MSMSEAGSQSKVLTGRHVLAIFGGFFAVVFAVNAYFLTVALTTHSGVVANEPYRKGLKYNERIEASDRQAKLGWSEKISFSSDHKHLVAAVHDRAGEPVLGLKLLAVLGRPATTREDQTLSFTETAPGRYEASISVTDDGAFVASVEAFDPLQQEAGAVFRGRQRLWLKH